MQDFVHSKAVLALLNEGENGSSFLHFYPQDPRAKPSSVRLIYNRLNSFFQLVNAAVHRSNLTDDITAQLL